MKQEFIDYLNDIFDSIQKIEIFTKDMSFKKFEKDDKTIFAVVRALEIIGEASKKIPDNIKQKHSNIPWKSMAGMRDKLIHEYFGVDVKVLWKTIEQDVPPLKNAFQKLLEIYK
ncbi:DUF86 domain-containing protein [Candidatus Micrarchaeota archaeon]|nr:DUF86 domain-containing protein [Candidatus Micrarchaeota archaeon]